MNESICDLLATFPTGYALEAVFMESTRVPVERFVSVNLDTNLAYFTKAGGRLYVADCTRLNSVEFL